MLRILCIALLAGIATAALTFKDCGKGEVSSLLVNQCPSNPCTVHKSKDTVMTVEFTANQDTKKAEIKVMAMLGGLKIDLPGIEKDGCKLLPCPLKKGMKYTLVYKLPHMDEIPPADVDVTAELDGDSGELACGTLRVSVKQ